MDTNGAHVAFVTKEWNNKNTKNKALANMSFNQSTLLLQVIKEHTLRAANVKSYQHLTLTQKRDLLEHTAGFLQNLQSNNNFLDWVKCVPAYHSIMQSLLSLQNVIIDMGYYLFPEWFPYYFTIQQVTDLHQKFDINGKQYLDLDTGFIIHE